MEIFKLFGSIFVDTDTAEKSLQKVDEKAEKFGDQLIKVGEKAAKWGGKLTLGLTTPLAALGTKAVMTAADFESAMSEVSAISGATGDDLEKLEGLAKKMGETTKFSASESAEALKYMAMAGWKTEDMLSGLEGVMNLAAASGEDLGITSDIVTDALTAFGLTAADSGHFADVLAKASSNANTNVSMMGETFKYVAPVAGSLGYQAEDVALAVGLMANSGIKASQAGTSLRSSLTNMVKPTKDMQTVMVQLGLATEETANVIDEGKLQKAQTKVENKTIDMEKAQIKYNEAVNKYGVSSSQAQTAALNYEKAQNNLEAAIYDLQKAQEGEIETAGIQNHLLIDSQGNTRSLREVIQMLREAFKGLSEEEQGQAAATLFGKEAMSGMLAIINASEEDFDKLAASIDTADGAAKEMADVMNDNLSGQITLLKSQIEALFIQFVELVMPHIKNGVEWLSKALEYISNLDDGTKKMIIRIGLLVAAIGPLLSIFGKGISVVGNVIKIGGSLAGGITKIIKIGGGLVSGGSKLIGFFGSAASFIGSTLIPAIASIGGPVLIVIGVIGALVAAGVALYKNWDTICEWAGNVWGVIQDIVGGAVEKIKGFFSGIINFVKDNWQGLALLLVNPFVGGFKLLYDNCEAFRNFIDGFVAKIKEGFHNFISGIAQKASDFKDKVADTIHNLKENVVGKFQELKEGAEQRFDELKENVSSKAHELKENAVNKINELKEKAGEKIAALKENAVNRFQELKENASARFQELKENVTSKAHELKENAVNTFQTLKEKAGEKISSLKDKAVNTFQTLKEKAGEKITSLKDKALEAFGNMRDKGLDGFEKLKSGALERFENLRTGISEKLNAVKDFVSGAVQKLKDFFKFDWKLPKIKLPHFNVSGSFSLNPLSIPKFGIDWYKDGGIMMKPTAFGINPSSGKMMAGGEAGPEAIAPIELLKGYIQDAVRERDDRLADILNLILELLKDYLPQMSRRQLVLDTGQTVGALAEPMSDALYKISSNQRRSH